MPETFAAFGTISLVPATNISGEKATRLRRSALAVVEPHSRSIVLSISRGIRVSGVTFTNSILSSAESTSTPISSTIASHSSRL